MQGIPLGAAAGGADALEEVLRRKLTQAIAQDRLKEEIRQANMQNQVQQGQLGLGQRRLGLDEEQMAQQGRQFDVSSGQRDRTIKLDEEMQPVKLEQLRAQTGEIQRKPQAEEAQRAFTLQELGLGHQNRMQEIGAAGANALRVAGVNHPGQQQTPQQQNEIDDTLALIDQIRQDPSRASSTGPLDSRGLGMVTDTSGVTRVNALHNQLVGKMSLAQAGKLKGQGQISDKERQLLKDAATALTQHLADQDYLNELGKVEAQFQRMKGGGAGAPQVGPTTPQEFDFVPGKGLVPRKK